MNKLKLTINYILTVLRKQKQIVKKEISVIMDQENQKALDEAECKKKMKSLSKKLEFAKEKAEKAKDYRNEQLQNIDEQIKKKREEVKEFESKIQGILEKYGNP